MLCLLQVRLSGGVRLTLLDLLLLAFSFPSRTLAVAGLFLIHRPLLLLPLDLRSMWVHSTKGRCFLVTRDSLLLMLGPLDFPCLEHEPIYLSARVAWFLPLWGCQTASTLYPSPWSSAEHYSSLSGSAVDTADNETKHCSSVVLIRAVILASINATKSSHLGMVCFLSGATRVFWCKQSDLSTDSVFDHQVNHHCIAWGWGVIESLQLIYRVFSSELSSS